jgi:hypothetical protein
MELQISKLLNKIWYQFVGLVIIFFPIQFAQLPFQQYFTNFIFGKWIAYLAIHIMHLPITTITISSDSRAMYLLFFTLFICSIAIHIIGLFLKKYNTTTLFILLQKMALYYLAFHFCSYGFDKIVKQQFYLPEPNILYTNIGSLHKDILYWSTIGTSSTYNVFLGIAEVLAGMMIIFRKTRLLGLVLAVGILINVVAVNFCFDINVKLFASFLLLISMIELLAYRNLFLQRQKWTITIASLPIPHQQQLLFKILYFVIISIEIIYPSYIANNWNDDIAPRPLLHGAYQIVNPITSKYWQQWSPKMVFMHKENYIIFQQENGETKDFKYCLDAKNKILQFSVAKNKIETMHFYQDTLHRQLLFIHQLDTLYCHALAWQKMNVLHNEFHWSVEDY